MKSEKGGYNDCFTGYPVAEEKIKSYKGPLEMDGYDGYYYTSDIVGKVKITSNAYELIQNQEYKLAKEIIAGILRNYFEKNIKFSFIRNNIEFDDIDQDFIVSKIYEQQFEYPKNFKDKAFHLLMHLYMKGGGEYHTFDLYSHKDYTLIYGSEDEFKRIINFLTEEELLNSKKTSTKDTILFEVIMTSKGIKKVEKEESNNFSQTLHEALSKDEIDLAIKLFEDSFTNSSIKLELVQISGRLSHLDKNNRLGTISLDDYTRHRNQIRLNLLEIIEKYNVNN